MQASPFVKRYAADGVLLIKSHAFMLETAFVKSKEKIIDIPFFCGTIIMFYNT
jgi:hypothetical protein